MSDGRRGRRLVAAALGIVLALVVTEVALRVVGPPVYAPRIDSYAFLKLDEHPDRLHWGLDPEIISWHAWDGDPYDTLPPGERMNYDDVAADGLRGPTPPADGLPRILFVGDSFTFGEGVAREDTFVERVGAALGDEGTAVRVRNAGVPGYGAFEASLRLPSLLASEEPEVVVLVFVPNDAIHVSDALGRELDLLKSGGHAAWVPRVFSVADQVWSAADRTADTERWYLSYYFGKQQAGWLAARDAVVDMHRRAGEAGAEFGVAYFPLLHRVGEEPLSRIEPVVRAACEAAGIPYLDLTPALEVAPEASLWVHPVDHHPNASAHERVAPALTEFVVELLARQRR